MEEKKIPISYKKLWILLIEKNITRAELGRMAEVASHTMTKIKRDEYVSLDVLVRICDVLDCTLDSIIEIGGKNANEQHN